MSELTHVPVMELLRASIDPASHRKDVVSKLDLLTGRLIAAAAHADADDSGAGRLADLAGGLALAALGLSAEVASRGEKTLDEFLAGLEQAGDDEVHKLMVETIRGMLDDQGVEIMGRTLAQDQTRFLDLLLALTTYCGTSILSLQAIGTPADITLTDLEDALRDAGDEAEPAVTS
ncbi:hypothetical protein ACFQL8_10535 [Streptomyces goshikiensis]|uniref:hypothetical protein n=1 Tax=Streptomyces goshikiensis TaxID=1942 RepID=UPI00167451D4|nr:hypothetical protein [Streptomyces goshikiensis]GHD82130.1 hypothetical protein GCM10010336_69030 [Streptomyces goshikiensis]